MIDRIPETVWALVLECFRVVGKLVWGHPCFRCFASAFEAQAFRDSCFSMYRSLICPLSVSLVRDLKMSASSLLSFSVENTQCETTCTNCCRLSRKHPV